MIARLAAAFAAGVMAGSLSLYLAPGFGLRATDRALTAAQGAAAGQEARGDQSEDNRAIEDEAAVDATESSRASCDDRVAVRERVLSERLAICLAEEPEPDESCSCAAAGPLRAYSDWVRDPQLDDGRASDAGAPKP